MIAFGTRLAAWLRTRSSAAGVPSVGTYTRRIGRSVSASPARVLTSPGRSEVGQESVTARASSGQDSTTSSTRRMSNRVVTACSSRRGATYASGTPPV